MEKKDYWNMKNGRDKIVNALWEMDSLPDTLKVELKACVKKLDGLLAQVEEVVSQ